MADAGKPKILETTSGVFKGGHTLWQYTGGTWILKKDACEEGYESGAPPKEKGSYEGEIRKTHCVPCST